MEEKKLSNEEIEGCIDDIFIPVMIKNAMAGDKIQARQLIQLAADYLAAGVDFPAALKFYLTEAFYAIAQGKSADKALLLMHGRGNNDAETGLYKKQDIAHEVRRLYWIGAAETIDEACRIITENGTKMVDKDTARKYYYEIFPGKPQRCPLPLK